MEGTAPHKIERFSGLQELVSYLATQKPEIKSIEVLSANKIRNADDKLAFERHINPNDTMGGFIERGKVKLNGDSNRVAPSAVLIGNITLNDATIGEHAFVYTDESSSMSILKSEINGDVKAHQGNASVMHSIIDKTTNVDWSGGDDKNAHMLIQGSYIGTAFNNIEINISNADLKIIDSQIQSDISAHLSKRRALSIISIVIPRDTSIKDYGTFTRRIESLEGRGYTFSPTTRAKISNLALPDVGAYRWIFNTITYKIGDQNQRGKYYIELSKNDNEEANKILSSIGENQMKLQDSIIEIINEISENDKASFEILETVTELADGVYDQIKYDNKWDAHIKLNYLDKGQQVIPFYEIIKNRKGECHEKALLLEMLIELTNKSRDKDNKIKSEFVEGELSIGTDKAGHAWVELHLPDGKSVIVDPTNPPYLYGTYDEITLDEDGNRIKFVRDDRFNRLVVDATPK